MEIQLLVRVENKPEKTITVSKDVIIGRSKTCQFRVLSNDVSREHCKLIVGDDTVAIRDLGSSNGTIVDGQTIVVGTEVALNPGAKVEVGPLKFVVQFESKKPATSTTPAASAKAVKPTKPTGNPTATSPTKPATAKPTGTTPPTKPAATATPKDNTKAKTPAANSNKAASASAATATKKKVAKKPAPAPASESNDSDFPFAVSSSEEHDEGPVWPDFLSDGGDEPAEEATIAAPTEPVMESAEAAAEAVSTHADDSADEPVFDFSPDEDTDGPAAMFDPTADSIEAPVSVAAAQSVPTEIPTAEVADDEPVFSDFSADGEESEFTFDPEAATASVPSTPTPVPASKPVEPPPAKLKSLFGLFGKGKKEKAAPAAAATPTPAPTPASAPTPTPSTKSIPAAATEAPVADDDGLNDFLTGGGSPAAESDDDTPDWMKSLS